MFEQLEKYKNHFLQLNIKWLKAGTINEQERKDFKKFQRKRFQCNERTACPPADRCSHSTYLEDHAQLAYGWFGLPKLMREINHDAPLTRWRALVTLSEFILNPYHAQRAINEFEIVRKIQNLFLRHRQNLLKEEHEEVAKILRIFYSLSIYINGAEQMARHKHLMDAFYTIILNKEKHTYAVGRVLRNMTEKPEVLLHLFDHTDAFDQIIKILLHDPCLPHYTHEFWLHVTHFLEIGPDYAIEKGLFETLHFRITHEIGDYHLMNMRCFGFLLRCGPGQKRFDCVDGIKMLYTLMTKENFDTYEHIVYAFMNGLLSKRALWRAREYPNLPEIITGFAKLAEKADYQFYCFKTIRLLCEMPIMKRITKSICICDLEQMKTLSSVSDCERARLICFLGREKWESHSPVEPLEQA